MADQEWVGELTHSELTTPEARAVLNKYGTSDDAHVALVKGQKILGAPYRLPKSMDSLPDDNVRNQFKAELQPFVDGLLDRVSGDDSFSDVNFAEGLADASKVNQELIAAFKKAAVENHWPKAFVKQVIAWSNAFQQQRANTSAQAKQQQLDTTKQVIHGLYNGEEGVKQNVEAVKRMFANHAGLTSEEHEQLGQEIQDEMLRSPVRTRALFNLAKHFVESETEETKGGASATKPTLKEQQNAAFPVITGHLWPKKTG